MFSISNLFGQNFWNDIRYFTPEEFYTNKEIHPVDSNLVIFIDEVRHQLQEPITISSGVRSKKYNHEVGGKEGSSHTIGKAIDIKVVDANYRAKLLFYLLSESYCRNLPIKIIQYSSHFHIAVDLKHTEVYID